MRSLTQELAGESDAGVRELEKLALYAAVHRRDAGDGAGLLFRELDATLGAAVCGSAGRPSGPCDALLEELGRDGATGPGVLAVLASQVQRF